MEEESQTPPNSEPSTNVQRCPRCDSVVPEGAERCIMCGAEVVANGPSEDHSNALTAAKSTSFQALPPNFGSKFGTPKRKRLLRSYVLWLLVLLTIMATGTVSYWILRSQGSRVILALQPTFTPLPSMPTGTPTWTPEASATPMATDTPIPSATPVPTDTPRPPRFHTVASGETLFGLSLLYRVSTGSIADSNNIPIDSPIQVNQELNIPWPTATPPLESMVLEIGEEKVVVDVTDCEIVTIQEGDSTYGLVRAAWRSGRGDCRR